MARLRPPLPIAYSVLALCAAGCDEPRRIDTEAGILEVDSAVSLACATPVGATPTALRLAGRFGSDAGVQTVLVDAYFPKGRVPGAPVYLTQRASVGVLLAQGTFGADGSSTTLTLSDPACRDSLTGRFAGPSDGFVGEASHNLSYTDVLRLVRGHVELCPAGEASALETAVPPRLLPGQRLVVTTNVPVDVTTLSTLATTPSRKVFPYGEGTAFSASITTAPWTAAALDLSGVKDVMGRPLGLGLVPIEALTADVVDGTFATPIPAGAGLGPVDVGGGVLYLGNDEGYLSVVSLGNAKPARTLRIRHRFACDPGDTPHAEAGLVSETGRLVSLDGACGDFVDRTVTLPEGGRWALTVNGLAISSSPCNYPSSHPTAIYAVDEAAFE